MKKRRRTKTSAPQVNGALRSAVLVGLGNIGSPLADHLARIGLEQITLIDPGIYEAKDIRGQNIDRTCIGRAKISIVARRLRRIDPDLIVHSIQQRVEDLPLGLLRADVVLSGLDSRASRAYLNSALRKLGGNGIWIDGGVEPSQSLARVSVYRASSNAACSQCAWSDEDYKWIEVKNPCTPEAAPTNAPAALGALAAAMQSLALIAMMRNSESRSTAAQETIICADAGKILTTSIGVNPDCRCPHESWEIQPLPASPRQLTLGRVFRLAGASCASAVALRVDGKSFVRTVSCQSCGHVRRGLLCLEGRLPRRLQSCRRCGRATVPQGFDQLDHLSAAALDAIDARWRSRTLASIGLLPRDIFTVEVDRAVRHFEISGKGV
jgi:molybdopterin/thiamine biosynthesis adenylyltransferase